MKDRASSSGLKARYDGQLLPPLLLLLSVVSVVVNIVADVVTRVVFWPRWWRLRDAFSPAWRRRWSRMVARGSAARSRPWESVTEFTGSSAPSARSRSAGWCWCRRGRQASSPSSSSSLMPTPPRCAVAKRTRKRGAERKRYASAGPALQASWNTAILLGRTIDRSSKRVSKASTVSQKKTKKFHVWNKAGAEKSREERGAEQTRKWSSQHISSWWLTAEADGLEEGHAHEVPLVHEVHGRHEGPHNVLRHGHCQWVHPGCVANEKIMTVVRRSGEYFHAIKDKNAHESGAWTRQRNNRRRFLIGLKALFVVTYADGRLSTGSFQSGVPPADPNMTVYTSKMATSA